MDLSIVIPSLREARNLEKLLPWIHTVLRELECEAASAGQASAAGGPRHVLYEIIVVDNHSTDGTEQVCAEHGAQLVHQTEPGYGGALWAGFERASGEYVLTMDADLSHLPDLIPTLWCSRDEAELIIASRYVEGGGAEMPLYRHVLSIILNTVYTRLLSLPVSDISSGFRLYRASTLEGLDLRSTDFDALEEILIKCYAEGSRILEVPFRYVPRNEGRSKVKLLQFGASYLRTLFRMWKLRNSIASADYDARAFDSPIPLQRYWQRRRHRIVRELATQEGLGLDIGCGSSRILGSLDEQTVGLDISPGKLRYARCYCRPLVNASAFALPFVDGAFDQVVCSQVVEHLHDDLQPFEEMTRVLRDGGRLVFGTPDYGRWNWNVIERLYRYFAPDAYGDEHITHYTHDSALRILQGLGFRLNQTRYILGAEMILSLTKRASLDEV
jgi:dolichol-phosphate mannosyltransferase